MAYIKDVQVGSDVYLIEPALYIAPSKNGAAYTATLTNFSLVTGATVQAKFAATNDANATLNVNSTGAKEIHYNGAKITASQFKVNHVYTLVYDGTQWQVVGDIDTNTTYSLSGLGGIGTISASGTAPLTLSGSKSGTTYTLTGSIADASASASGVVNTDAQTFSGIKTFDNGLHIYGTISTQGTGSVAGTMYPGGAYHSGHNSIVLHGDTAGISGIGFTSEKATKSGTTTNINSSSDRAFIQYHAYGVTPAAEGTAPTLATSGELGTLVIGVGNDANDTIRLQAPGTAGILHQIGATAYPIPHTTNTNGSVGGTTTPVYVEAGVIKAGTALGTASQKAESYFAKASHNHAASDINSGTFDVARIPNSVLKWQTTTTASTDLYDFGVYVNQNNAAGSSMNGGNYFNILNVPYRKASGNTKADWGWQLGNTTSNDSRLWYRTSGDNVWGDWQTIAHATQSTSNVGSATQPVYMTAAGVITAGTALKDLAYISKGSGNTKFLREDGTWQTALTAHQSLAAYAPLNSPALTGTPTAPTAADGTNTTQIATTAFVMSQFKYNDAMIYKGVVNANSDLPATHYQGWTYKVGTAGTYAGVACEIGDMIICNTDGTSANNAHWNVIQTNIDGAVIGPASSTDNAIARFDGATGKIIQNSAVVIEDSGVMKVTSSNNTFSIGSQNTSFNHLYNSANIPFIFNNSILTLSGNLGNTTYPFNNLYIGAKGSRSIYYVGTKATNAMITFLDNTGDAYGNGIKIGGGGTVVVGAGESATNLSVTAGTETLYLTSDGTINIEAGGDTIANRVGIQVTAAGHIIPVKAEAANNNVQNLGASDNKWANVYTTTLDSSILKLHQGTGANPSLSGNARIEFDHSNGQPVVISYTPNDSYRAPAGLKVMGGTSATPAWFEVEGNIYAAAFKGNADSATSSEKLTYQPRINTLEELDAFHEASVFKVATLAYIEGHSGTLPKNDGMIISVPWSASYGHQFYIDDNSYQLHHRFLRPVTVNDVSTPTWADWVQIIDSSNYTSYTVKKDGTGASGTWGISISGTATLATTTADTSNALYLIGVTSSATTTLKRNTSITMTGGNITLQTLDSTATSMRHLDAGKNAIQTDHSLYIGYGSRTFTSKTLFYYSTGTTDTVSSRTQFAEINNNGLYALTRFGVNGQNTSYNFYVNGTSYLKGNITVGGALNMGALGTPSAYPATANKITWSGGTDGAEIYYQVASADAGRLIFNTTDDANCLIGFAYAGTIKAYMANSTPSYYPATTDTGSIGTSDYKWANIYATTFNGALSGNATSSSALITTKTLTASDDENTLTGTNQITYYNHINTNRPANCPSDSYNSGLLVFGNSRGQKDTFQLEWSGNTQQLYMRGWIGTPTTIPSWNTVIHSGNYTNYTVTKTGTGATGSNWGISITGSSASCTGNAATANAIKTAGTTAQFYRGDNSWSDTLVGPLYINNTTDASGTGDTGALVIGSKTGENIAIDTNEVMARNNKATSTLYLNNDGGLVSVGSGGLSTSGKLESTGQLRVINNSSSNADDALVYISNTSSSDWTMKLINSNSSYGLYIEGTSNNLLRVGTNDILNITDNAISSNRAVNIKGKLNLNRVNDASFGRISYYSPSYVTWFDYMSESGNGNAPTGGKPSTLGNVTTWAIRHLIEQSSGYGWIWESCANTAASANTVTPIPRMALSSNNGQLRIAPNASSTANESGGLIIDGSVNGGSGNVALELWRGGNASWQFANEGGNLYIRNNWTTAKQSSYTQTSITVNYNNGNTTFAGKVTANNGFSGSLSGDATSANYLTGFSSRATTMGWGNQTGSVITCFATPKGGGWGFRDDNPAAGQVSMTIDGTVYIKEGGINVGDAIKSISRSGTTFTYTTLWGNTGTFTQQDTNNAATHTVKTTTKYYVTGTETASTSTGGDTFDTGIYATTTAGQLNATTFKVNEAVTLQYNTTDQSLDFIF